MAENSNNTTEKKSHNDYRWNELTYGIMPDESIEHFLLEGEAEKCRLTAERVQYVPMFEIIAYTICSFGLFLVLYICHWSYIEKMFDNIKLTVILTNKRIIAVEQVDGGNGLIWKRPREQIIRHFPVKEVVSLTKSFSKTHEHPWYLRPFYGKEKVEYSELWLMFNFFSKGGQQPAAVHKASSVGKFDSNASADMGDFQKAMGELIKDGAQNFLQTGMFVSSPIGWGIFAAKIFYQIVKLLFKFLMNVGGIAFYVDSNVNIVHFKSCSDIQTEIDLFAAAVMEAVEVNALDNSTIGPSDSVTIATTQDGPLISGDGKAAVPVINVKKLCLPVGEVVQDLVQFVYVPTMWDWIFAYLSCGLYYFFVIKPKLLFHEALVRTNNRLIQLKSMDYDRYFFEMSTYYLKMQPACVVSYCNTPAKNEGACCGMFPIKVVYACFVLTSSGSYGYLGYEEDAVITKLKSFFYPFLKQSMKGHCDLNIPLTEFPHSSPLVNFTGKGEKVYAYVSHTPTPVTPQEIYVAKNNQVCCIGCPFDESNHELAITDNKILMATTTITWANNERANKKRIVEQAILMPVSYLFSTRVKEVYPVLQPGCECCGIPCAAKCGCGGTALVQNQFHPVPGTMIYFMEGLGIFSTHFENVIDNIQLKNAIECISAHVYQQSLPGGRV